MSLKEAKRRSSPCILNWIATLYSEALNDEIFKKMSFLRKQESMKNCFHRHDSGFLKPMKSQ